MRLTVTHQKNWHFTSIIDPSCYKWMIYLPAQKLKITQTAIAQTPAKKVINFSSKIGHILTPSCQFMAQNFKYLSCKNLCNYLTSQKIWQGCRLHRWHLPAINCILLSGSNLYFELYTSSRDLSSKWSGVSCEGKSLHCLWMNSVESSF